MLRYLFSILALGSFAFANLNVAVSILPQKFFLEQIGKDKVDITLMVLPGNSPHTYEPKASQMKHIAKADLYLSIDVEFEHIWLSKFQSLNPNMKLFDISQGITKLPIMKHSHDDEHEHEEEEHEHKETLDPHIWTSPENVKVIVKNIYEALIKYDSKNAQYYKQNYEQFLEKLNKFEAKLQNILQNTPKGTRFMVFHPAWGYFANQFGLTQLAIEAGGKNPKPKQVMYLIEEAKEENVTAVFTAPEFSDKIAKQIASQLNIPVIKISPLHPKWFENIEKLAKAIAHKK